MAYTPQMQGAPTMPQGYSPSPYLGAQIGQLGQQINQDFTRNTLPAIRSGALVAGGYGGSRQGIAEGIAAGDASRGFSNAATNLLGNDYQAQMARNLQKYQGDQSYNLGLGNLDLGNKNADNQYALGQANIGLGYAGLANSKDIAGMNNQTQRYLGDQSNALGYAGLQNQYGIASMNNDTNRYGIDTNNTTQRYGIDTTNAYNNRALDVNMRGQDIQWQNNNNQYNLGMTQANNQRYGIDRTYDLGMTNANNQRYGLENQYNLGMGQLDLGRQTQEQNFYGQQRGQDITQLGIGADMYNNTLRAQAGAGTAGQGGGFNWQQALGGAIGGTQLWNNLNKPTANTASTSSTGWW